MDIPKPKTFHACTIKHNGITNRIITPVGLCQAFDPAQNPISNYPVHQTNALWDTGATKSVITEATAAALNIPPVGTVMVQHAGGEDLPDTFLLNFLLPNNVGVYGVLVSKCKDIAGNFGAIIGMDIICKGDFAITNVGNKTCMSFRYPSIHTIDYVEEANRLKTISRMPKVGRNDPCPCGSGKKYKKCHGH
jgi:hypothetical protein